MKRVAENRADKDPETAKELKEAAEKADEGNLAGQMKEAGDSIQQNKLNEARKKQERAVAELEKLVKNLEDRREAELDRLARKLREAQQKVEELQDEQERLQQKMREAGKIGDPQKREEELKKLARKQRELQQKTEEVMKQLSRLGSERARQSLSKAGEEMAQAEKQLSRGQRDEDKQEDVLDRLEEAREELEGARKKAEEELGREQLARVADVIKRIRERQQGHVEEAKRIQDAVLQRKGWTRPAEGEPRQPGPEPERPGRGNRWGGEKRPLRGADLRPVAGTLRPGDGRSRAAFERHGSDAPRWRRCPMRRRIACRSRRCGGWSSCSTPSRNRRTIRRR